MQKIIKSIRDKKTCYLVCTIMSLWTSGIIAESDNYPSCDIDQFQQEFPYKSDINDLVWIVVNATTVEERTLLAQK